MLRTAFCVFATLAATAAIGFGGLASWAVSTQNNGSNFASGTAHHRNVATVGGSGSPITCTDQAGACGAIFIVAGIKPAGTATGTVQITNTGSLPSSFALTLTSATVSGAGVTLCTSLTLTIVDAQAPVTTVYSGALSTMPAQALNRSTGGTTWAAGDSNTFTFTLTLPAASPSTDQASTCTAVYTWTQTNT